jgi:hypothetical protein
MKKKKIKILFMKAKINQFIAKLYLNPRLEY